MSKAPCCWASNELSRDKENYIRCSTRQNPQSNDNKDKKGKPDKNMCCGPAFRLQMAKEAEKDANVDIDAMCGPSGKGKKKVKPDKDKFRCFVANMICMKLYMPGRDFEERDQLQMNVVICKGCTPVLCSNRIGVNCMPSEPSARFSIQPECLDKALTDGVNLSVKYMNKEIGRGCFAPPDSVILRMINTTEEVVYTTEVELTCKGCTVGMCTVRLSMTMKCQSIEDDDETDDDGDDDDDDCTGVSMGEDTTDSSAETSSDPCQGFVSIDDQSDDTNDFCETSNNNSRTCGGDELRSRKLIDVAGPYNVYSADKSDDGCLKIEASPGPGHQFSFASRSYLGEGNVNRMCSQASAPKLKQMGVKPERSCLMCHADVSWLPQIAACPHCGYKPLPIFTEKEYDESATAKDIIVDFFQQKSSESKISNTNTCRDFGSESKTEEAFESIVSDYKSLKQSIKKCKSIQPCNKTSSKKLPTDLVSIFAEMQKLFEVGEDDSDKKLKIKQICDEACKLAKASKKHRKYSNKIADPCAEPKKTKRRKAQPKFNVKSKVYAPMDKLAHPRLGHTNCFDDGRMVPGHMGWLWTDNPLAKLPGWRPGAIRRSIRELMGYFLKDYPVDSVPISKYMSYHKQKPKPSHEMEEKPEDLVQLPTLHIEKKNDEYLITLRPLKDPDTLKRAANPYANMKPVQFRIVKNPLLKKVRELKRCLKNMGFSKCKCHRPVMQCYCRSFIDKKQLVDELQRQCAKRELHNCENELVLSDTTDSEAEFDFGVTPPAGLMHPERLKVSHRTNAETQYNENDWALPTMYPHPPNAYVQYGGCVIGERKDRFPWIFGKGFVHQEPKPPRMRNPPKKTEKKPAPGSTKPRQKGGYNSESQAATTLEKDRKDSQLYDARHQRLNRAAYPPTAKQFQKVTSKVSLSSKKVRFSASKTERFST
ncbi:PREDICTED: uncharacterized protein LOC108619435 [Drosophila arizonae]|uniref:Uncharacterized protein LOC108619435 n=1 Tax=Drosophila arizonae TaxID=7263 RepID=A0ABM1PWC1_DROAR|nr:PREDICTED: uncharacterized protein LOC108619435 [Drosophila arizonae]